MEEPLESKSIEVYSSKGRAPFPAPLGRIVDESCHTAFENPIHEEDHAITLISSRLEPQLVASGLCEMPIACVTNALQKPNEIAAPVALLAYEVVVGRANKAPLATKISLEVVEERNTRSGARRPLTNSSHNKVDQRVAPVQLNNYGSEFEDEDYTSSCDDSETSDYKTSKSNKDTNMESGGEDEEDGAQVKPKVSYHGKQCHVHAKVEPKSEGTWREANLGQRWKGSRMYDSVLGQTCHWCRQKTVEDHVQCWKCPIRFCRMCLLNRNGEYIRREMMKGVRWLCPKCRGGCGPGCKNCCNCGPCRKEQKMGPTGQIIRICRVAGFSNAHDYLVHQKTSEGPKTIAARKEGRGWISGGTELLSDGMENYDYRRFLKSTQVEGFVDGNSEDMDTDSSSSLDPKEVMKISVVKRKAVWSQPGVKKMRSSVDMRPTKVEVVQQKSRKAASRHLKQDPIKVRSQSRPPKRAAAQKQEPPKERMNRPKREVITSLAGKVKQESLPTRPNQTSTRIKLEKVEVSHSRKARLSPSNSNMITRVKLEKLQNTLEGDKVERNKEISYLESTSGGALKSECVSTRAKKSRKGGPKIGSFERQVKVEIENEVGVSHKKKLIISHTFLDPTLEKSDCNKPVCGGEEKRTEALNSNKDVLKASDKGTGYSKCDVRFKIENEVGIYRKRKIIIGRTPLATTSEKMKGHDSKCGGGEEEIDLKNTSNNGALTCASTYVEDPSTIQKAIVLAQEAEANTENEAHDVILSQESSCVQALPSPFMLSSESCKEGSYVCQKVVTSSVESEVVKVGNEELSQDPSRTVCDLVDGEDTQTNNFSTRKRQRKDGLSGVKWSLPSDVQGNAYSEKLKEILAEPVDWKQLADMWELATRRKPVLKLRQTRGRTMQINTKDEGLSYLDHHPDLALRLKESSNPKDKLVLLRGFFFWIQHSCMEGAYKPWALLSSETECDDCILTDGPDCEVLAVVLSLDDRKDVSCLVKSVGPVLIDLDDDDDVEEVPAASVQVQQEFWSSGKETFKRQAP